MKKRVVEAFIAMCNTLNLATVYMCLCIYTLAFFLYLVLCPVSCTARSSLNVPSPTGRLPNSGSHVCLASRRSLCRNLSVQPKDVLLANAVNPANVLRLQLFHCDLLGFLWYFWSERYTIVVCKFDLTLL